MLRYWYHAIVPDVAAGKLVLVVAHGNSLRALVKQLDGISEEAIAKLNLPTVIPIVYHPRHGLHRHHARWPLSRSGRGGRVGPAVAQQGR